MKSPLITFIIPKPNHQEYCANLIMDGMKRHGIQRFQILRESSKFQGSDLVVMWAWRPYMMNSRWQDARRKQGGRPILVMERAYVGDRHKWFSLGYNGLNGNANFHNSHITDITRWNKHFEHELKPWKQTTGKRALVCGQCFGDASINGVDINQWYKDTCETLKRSGYTVFFREHPLNKRPWADYTFPRDKHKTLEDGLNDYDYIATYNSNSGVVSVLNGNPTISADKGSMAWDVTSHLPEINNTEPDRKSWCAKLAYCQWLPEEIQSGETWEHLKAGINQY